MTAPTILPSRSAVVAWLADTGERVVRTFVQAFLAVFVPLLPVPGTTLHWDTLEKAAAAGVAAGVAAALAFVMALLARWSGDPASASFVKSNAVDAYAEPLGLTSAIGTLQSQPPVVVNVYQGSEPAPARTTARRGQKGHGRPDVMGVVLIVLLVVVILFVAARI